MAMSCAFDATALVRLSWHIHSVMTAGRIGELLGTRQRFAGKARNALSQRVVETLDVMDLHALPC
jgi:hypothetical protein